MALLNQLLSENDLANMTNDQRDFLAQRIDFVLNSKDVQKIIASKLQSAVSRVAPEAKLLGNNVRSEVSE